VIKELSAPLRVSAHNGRDTAAPAASAIIYSAVFMSIRSAALRRRSDSFPAQPRHAGWKTSIDSSVRPGLICLKNGDQTLILPMADLNCSMGAERKQIGLQYPIMSQPPTHSIEDDSVGGFGGLRGLNVSAAPAYEI
jgi:hypothetical protein